ncbi:MAG: 2-oxoacid:acceptor oxidoreductase subunit alpha [Syntrophales bacterium]|jgi:2-oxoglutarate ferredoxin oxidoreductase subunit alpha|nr:2-oxoacid:acceptor oxidoreductase subunit alpha [Syntrophales bacterium]MDY0044061.1 2-oxoacid:acceptor oxidoreductase subunit alpha [Syntrophales bacterium]
MDDINIIIAGAAGEGIQTIGNALADTIAAQGYAVFSWQEYESRIRGGQNSYSVRVSEKIRNSPLIKVDILLGINENAVEKYKHLLEGKGVILAEKAYTGHTISIPFTQIAKEELGNKIFANSVATGALSAMLGIELDTLTGVLSWIFADKDKKIIEANHRAARLGYESATKECVDRCPWNLPKKNEGHYYVISGNEAIPVAAAHAGCRFIAAYPMTPSTGIITKLAQAEDQLGVFTQQAEDEIAAINMAIGASFAGARSMTATSGGGFALMVEGISLAGMTETPIVIVLGQRPGPATGLPTRTAQGDLLFAVNAGHGEFPKCVMAPSDPKDAFHKIVRAFNLADKFQIPVIVLTDQFLADAQFSIADFEIDKAEPVQYMADPESITDYKRYLITDEGISPRLYPGQSSHLVCADSDEHDEEGHITEDLKGVVIPMVNKRLAKYIQLKREIMEPEELEVENTKTILVSWGSSRNAIVEAREILKNDGISAGMIHFTELWPLPEYHFPAGKRYISVENNATDQFARLLKSEFGITMDSHINRYDGLPLTGEYIRSRVNEK